MKIHPQTIMIFSETPHNILFNTSTYDTEPIFPVTLETPSITKEESTSINPIPEFTILL